VWNGYRVCSNLASSGEPPASHDRFNHCPGRPPPGGGGPLQFQVLQGALCRSARCIYLSEPSGHRLWPMISMKCSIGSKSIQQRCCSLYRPSKPNQIERPADLHRAIINVSPCCVPASNNNRPRANPRKIRSAARAAVPSTQLPRTLVRIRKLPCCRRRTSHIGKLNKTRISNVSDIVELLAGSWVQFFLVQ